ncbi:MAG TPA: hypothetical protein DD618_04860 [Acholeplasmatales bacterium]|nr:hypothetical protein [Acholeplasmatales bacterium]
MNILKKNYLFSDIFSLDGFLEFEGKIPFEINDRAVTFRMYSSFQKGLDPEFFIANSEAKEKEPIRLFVLYEAALGEDAYSLDITAQRNVIIKASSDRGIRYAFRVLNQLAEKSHEGSKLPIVLIEDAPSFRFRGIIEGYYGEPWSFEEHLEMANFMDEYRLNSFMYAPKLDPYHREKWFEPYPEAEFFKLKEIIAKLSEKNIDFYYCISPGHANDPKDAFKYTGEEDFARLFAKLQQVIAIGVSHFGLLLDDINYQLSGLNRQMFSRPGIAHAHICNQVYDFLKSNVLDPVLVMCPTEYHQIGDSEYRNDLKEYLDDDIYVFWTGDRVCAEAITESDAKLTQEAFQKRLFIWDNFPVSDFTYGVREFIAPIKNRTAALSNYAEGYMINPSLHYQISKIGMITMAHYAWNSAKYDYEKSFEMALRSVSDAFFKLGNAYFQYNYPNVLSHGNLANEKKMVASHDYPSIQKYVGAAAQSAQALLKIKHPIIDELAPWLKRTIAEEAIINKIMADQITEEELKLFLEDIKFSGSKILDYLICDKKLLNEEDFVKLIKKRRGPEWYRVFENKRWGKI